MTTKYSDNYAESIKRYFENKTTFFIDVCVYPTIQQTHIYATSIPITDGNSIATWKVFPKKNINN